MPRQIGLSEHDSIMQEARKLVQEGKPGPAVELLDRLLETVPDHAEGNFFRGAALLDLGRPADALPDLVRVCSLTPGDARCHYNLAVAHYQLDDFAQALSCCRAALEVSPGFELASGLQSNIPAHGPGYRTLLDQIHQHLRPRTYVEIGVFQGATVNLAWREARVIGIDPYPSATMTGPGKKMFNQTSDDFFARHDLTAELGGLPVDIAFIDGMHQFEFVLRDFLNLERHATPHSVILIHDTLPPGEEWTGREFREHGWTGDVWRAVVALRENRPDLAIDTIATPLSGLTVVRNLDPGSRVLSEKMDFLCREYIQHSYADAAEHLGAKLNLFPNDWEQIKRLLPAPYRQ